MPILEGRLLYKSFKPDEQTIQVIRGVDLSIDVGDFISIVGKSGSGKSTLLYLLSGLERPTQGDVLFKNEVFSDKTDDEITKIRRECFGFVFQSFNLIPNLSVFENIALPLYLDSINTKLINSRIELISNTLDITGLLKKKAFQLSGGEQQRVSIARALVMEPTVLFADEPTGNLDSVNGEIVFNLLKMINREHNTTILMVTHDVDLAFQCDKQIEMEDGILKAKQ